MRRLLLLLLCCGLLAYPPLASFAVVQSGMTKSSVQGSGGGGGSNPDLSSAINNLSVNNLNSGTNATSSTFWRGDGTWNAVTKSNVGLGNADNTSDATKNAATATLSNKRLVPRAVLCTPSSNTITPNGDTTDVCYYYSLAATTTIANPTTAGSFDDQQPLIFELSGSSPQSLSWGTNYSNECGLPLPTGITGSSIYNRFMFRYSATSTKWCLEASTKGDDTRISTLATSSTYTCPADTSDECEMQMTGGAGTLTVAAPTGSPANGKKLILGFICTNAQTFSWNGTFIASPNLALPVTCPADTAKETFVQVRYSTVLTKWQVVSAN